MGRLQTINELNVKGRKRPSLPPAPPAGGGAAPAPPAPPSKGFFLILNTDQVDRIQG